MARELDEAALWPIVQALAAGGWVSGEGLAAQLGIGRAALAKRLAHLADWGLEWEAQAGLGYRLAAPLRLLEVPDIRAALPALWRDRLEVQLLRRTDSTNSRLLETPGEAPRALLAEMQTGGRGRRGRSWRSPFGVNLYLSLAWRYPAWPPQLSALPLALGVAVATALREHGVPAVGLKWPNDLWVGDAKLGGLLVEQRGEAGGDCRLVIGLGLNVSMRAAQAADLEQAWTSIDRLLPAQAPADRSLLAGTLLGALATSCERFEQTGFAPFLPAWRALDILAGRAVVVRTEGSAPLHGEAVGVDAHGALRLRTADGERQLTAGDISLRPV
jgi:birA, biotin-[acetyl-CoA-carboxylase] ligase region